MPVAMLNNLLQAGLTSLVHAAPRCEIPVTLRDFAGLFSHFRLP